MGFRLSLASIHVSDLYQTEDRFALDITCIAPHLKLNPVLEIYVNPRRATKAAKEYQKILEAISSLKDTATFQITAMFDGNNDLIAISNHGAIAAPEAAEWINLTTPTICLKKKPYKYFSIDL